MILSNERTVIACTLRREDSLVFIKNRHRICKEEHTPEVTFLPEPLHSLWSIAAPEGQRPEGSETATPPYYLLVLNLKDPYVPRAGSQPCVICLHVADKVDGDRINR